MFPCPLNANADRLIAVEVIRQMRGETKAQLVRVVNGDAYITKWADNPWGARVLISEWIGHMLMAHLGLPVPAIALIDGMVVSRSGIHFGSRYPGDPSTASVYDFLPDRLLSTVANGSACAAGGVAFDLWVSNADFRQILFYRPNEAVSQDFRGVLIDNSHLFGGPTWKFQDSKRTGMYFSRAMTAHIQHWDDIWPWLHRITAISEEDVVGLVTRGIPEDWCSTTDSGELHRVADELLQRGRTIVTRVEQHLRARPAVFPAWRETRLRGALSTCAGAVVLPS
jgi:hypothetical protein